MKQLLSLGPFRIYYNHGVILRGVKVPPSLRLYRKAPDGEYCVATLLGWSFEKTRQVIRKQVWDRDLKRWTRGR